MLESILNKNLIIGAGGAGTIFLDTAKEQHFADTDYLSIKSEADVNNNSNFLQTAERIFIVGSFASPNPNSAFYLTESVLEKVDLSSQKVYLLIILPFKFEGSKRRELSFSRIKKFYDLKYRILVFDNQDMIYNRDAETPLLDSFERLYKNICLKITEFMQGEFSSENRNWHKWQFLLNFYAREINELDWFQHFPSMNPYIGSNYLNNTQLKILFIGEKSYQPSDSPLPLHIKELAEVLSEYFSIGIDQVFTNTTYLNILKRPEPEEVIPVEYQLERSTYQNLAATIKQVIAVIKPDLVIVVSDNAWDKISPFLGLRVLSRDVKVEFVCSPDSEEWFKKNSEFGKNKLRKLLNQSMGNSLIARFRRLKKFVKNQFSTILSKNKT